MEVKLDLQIENLYGGDGITRTIQEKVKTFSRKKGVKKTKADIDVSVDRSVDEEQYEIKDIEVNTFKRDEDNNPVMRLGGIHGKLWGHFKASGKMLATLGEDGFDSMAYVDRLMMMINLTPTYISITNHEPMQEDSIPQIMNGMSKALIAQRFDYIPKCNVQIKMTFPEVYRERVLKILTQAEQLAGLNKRRSTITILNREEVFGKE